jgi:hypothetical protein
MPADSGLDLLVLPAMMTEAPDLPATLGRLQPRQLLVYGGEDDKALAKTGVPCQFTREGAVSVYLTATALRVRQWGSEKNHDAPGRHGLASRFRPGFGKNQGPE